MAPRTKSPQRVTPKSLDATQELVDPAWMLKMVIAVVLVAAVCAYLAICALFWHGQWQLVLSPSRIVAANPSSVGLPFEDVRFGPSSGGQPELTGWWIPTNQPQNATVLVMHDGSGSMSNVLPQARMLHDSNLNVLLFDYRGYGKSSGDHPSQQMMERDTEAAFAYLSGLRRIPTKNLIAFGNGVGASLATRLCAQHRDVAALILESADGDLATRAALDSRSRMVPFGLLFNQKFPLADQLHELPTPKLLLSFSKGATPPVDFARASDPKLTAEIDSPQDTVVLSSTLRRFLDSYVVRQPSTLIPQSPNSAR